MRPFIGSRSRSWGNRLAGRRKLSSAGNSFSIKLRIDGSASDQELLDVASAGQLTDKKQVQQQLERLLGDSSIGKARILRFFSRVLWVWACTQGAPAG